MIATVLALTIALHGPGQDTTAPAKESASQILTKAFGHYASAQTAAGTIKMTQTALGVSLSIETDLQFDRPSKLFLRQSRTGARPHQWLVTSDGVRFSYDRPEGELGKDRYVEFVTQGGITQKISDYYIAAAKSLGEQSAMLDVALSEPGRLRRLKSQWASLAYQGRVNIDGQLVHKITGLYREDGSAAASGRFEIYVTEDGDFVRYVVAQRFVFPSKSKDPIDVNTQWDSTIKVGAKTDPSLYQVVP
ncbi:MAG: hypothetical protein P4L46_03785 [Fimbriimonas sp.]|nr:hypothetical protein [Fimbriimonas sp.]